MANRVNRIDPPAVDDAIVLIFDLDSMTASNLYPPGASAKHARYTITSDDKARNMAFSRRSDDGAMVIIGEAAYPHAFRKSKKNMGTVKIVGRGDVPIAEWLRLEMRDNNPDTATVAVKIGEDEYIWQNRRVGEGFRSYVISECHEGDDLVAKFEASHTLENGPSTGRVVQNAHVALYKNALAAKAESELLFSMVVTQQLLRTVRAPGSGMFGWVDLFNPNIGW